MNIKKILADFAIVFSVSLVVVVFVTLVWNLIFHGSSTIDWETSFLFRNNLAMDSFTKQGEITTLQNSRGVT